MDEEEIQFGDVQFDQPDVALRPDQDDHYAIAVCGAAPETDLPIFVDLDVMRDMEAHAQSDKTVELGGVLLGRRNVDDAGQAYVVVTDWLQADHYESTRSRFKFTHETWSEITKQRSGYPNDTEMVGWYHTHPGWGVFLSDMDMFICKNFFNRPLDVALVIDPCNLTRGWFQWNDDAATRTREVSGFYLTTNRHRASELEYFADLYNGELTMSDPRYSEPSRAGGAAPIINVADRRNPVFDIAVLGMLAMQFVLLALIAWRMMAPPVVAEPDKTGATVEASQLALQNEGYRQAILDIVDPENEETSRLKRLLDKFDETQLENQRLAANQDAQVVYSSQLKSDADKLNQTLAKTRTSKELLEANYNKTREKLNEKVDRIKRLETQIETGEDPEASSWAFDFSSNWWWAGLGCIIVGAATAFGTLYYVRFQESEGLEAEDELPKSDQEPSSSDENINFS